jgi:hypothetical protein
MKRQLEAHMLRTSALMVLLALALLLSACSFIPGVSGGSSGTLSFDGATENGLRPGETITGTNIRFIGDTGDGAEVMINDQRAIKKVGDSLDWKGTVAPGVEVSMPQRIVLVSKDRLQTVGTVRVTISGVNPQPGQAPAGGRYVYKVGSGSTVRKGDRVPGTTLVYRGKTDEGAQFEGTGDYPYRRIGDSVTWQGQVAPGVYLDTTLRVGAYTDDIVTLAGLATITVQ